MNHRTYKLMATAGVAAALFGSGLVNTATVSAATASAATTTSVLTRNGLRRQIMTAPRDLNRKVNTYMRTGHYSNSAEDLADYKRNVYRDSPCDNVAFDPTVPMSTADRNYYNLYVTDLINQVRAQAGVKPLHATVLGRNFAHQISDNYTAEHHPYGHDGAMIQKTSDKMGAAWTGENISSTPIYEFSKHWPSMYPYGYTHNVFKQDIFNAMNSMFLDDAHENYGHTANFLNPNAYSYGFSYRFMPNHDIIMNFDGISKRSAIIHADGTVATKKPAKKSTKKTVKKSTKKSAKKSTKKSAKKSTKKAVKKSTKKAVKKSAKNVVKKSTKKSAKKSAKNVVKKSTKKHTKKQAKKQTAKHAKKVAKRRSHRR